MNDPEILWEMYVKVVGGAEDALNLLSEREYGKAETVLVKALQSAEALYVSSEQPEDELEKWRTR